jgi:XapX domain-containing protein
MKSLLGLALAFAIGFACRAFGIPSPAPPILVGALLVVAMTIGYLLVDRAMARPAQHAIDCGGPSGLAPSATNATASTTGGADARIQTHG